MLSPVYLVLKFQRSNEIKAKLAAVRKLYYQKYHVRPEDIAGDLRRIYILRHGKLK